MDPHLVQDSVEHNDYLYEDWLNCEAEDMPRRKSAFSKKNITIDQIKIKEDDRLSYHCT